MDESGRHSEDEVRQIIAEAHRRRLRTCHYDAFRRWEDRPASERKDLSARSRANNIHDYVVTRAAELFDGLPGVAIVDRRDVGGYFSLVFNDVIVARFKKFRDDSFATCGIATQEQQRFALQEPPLTGMRTSTNLVVGYLLDEFEASISRIAIACSKGEELLWAIDITDDDAGYGEVIPMVDPDQPGGYRLRSGAEEAEGEAEEKRDVEGDNSD